MREKSLQAQYIEVKSYIPEGAYMKKVREKFPTLKTGKIRSAASSGLGDPELIKLLIKIGIVYKDIAKKMEKI